MDKTPNYSNTQIGTENSGGGGALSMDTQTLEVMNENEELLTNFCALMT